MAYIKGKEVLFSPILNITNSKLIANVEKNLANSRKAVVYKGGTVGEVADFDNLASEIESIPSGDANYLFVDDTDTAYRKQILSGASPLAKIKSIGGMTYKCNNLMPKTTKTSTTLNGITFTVQEDGSVVVNGTATAKTSFTLVSNVAVTVGTAYTLSGCPEGGSYSTYALRMYSTSASGYQAIHDYGSGETITASYINYRACIEIENGTTVTNIRFKPMLNEGETALPYEPYFEGLRDTKVTSLMSHGKNFLPDDVKDASSWVNYKPDWYGYNLDLPNGWYCLSMKLKEEGNGIPYLSFYKSTNGGINYEVVDSSYSGGGYIGTGYITTGNGLEKNQLWFKVDNEAGIIYRFGFYALTQSKLDYLYDMQVEAVELEQEPSTSYPPATYAPATEYVPYRGVIDTVAIPEAVQALEGYGTSGGYIDFERKVWIYGDNDPVDISAHLTDDNYIEVEGGGTITAVNEHENAVPFNIAYIRRTT
jgi:hypothetical protein